MNRSSSSDRWHAVKVILDRVSQTRFWGWGIFITLSVSLAISSILLVNDLRYTETNQLLLAKQPFTTAILVSVILISLYLALTASLNVAGEYNSNTIEMLFYGPVDEASYMLGNFLAQLKIFVLSLAAVLVWMNLSIWLLNLEFRLDMFAMLLAAVFMCAQLVAFGLLLAAWGGKRRSTLVYFLLVILLIGGIQAADLITSTLVQIQNATVIDPLVITRNILSVSNQIIAWVSPYAQLNNAYQALLNHSTAGYIGMLALMLAETGLMLGGSIWLLKKKGVRG